MLWLIDGYNVIRRDPELAGIERRSLEEGRAALLRLLAVAARTTGDEFVAVFDGARSPVAAPGDRQVRVVFSSPPETADDVLIRMARERGAGAIVVTSDRTIQGAARRARAVVVAADMFLERASGLGPDEVEAEDDGAGWRGSKRGNPRRLSRDERDTRRALGRLRPPRE
jgi:predicted RNA-binding protein with PIN domain